MDSDSHGIGGSYAESLTVAWDDARYDATYIGFAKFEILFLSLFKLLRFSKILFLTGYLFNNKIFDSTLFSF